MLKKIMIMMLLFIVAGCQRQENLQETPIHTSIQLFSTLTNNSKCTVVCKKRFISLCAF